MKEDLSPATAVDGRTVSFPARVLRPFLTYQGIQGEFLIRFDKHHKFVGIEKLKKIGYQVVGTDQNAEREFDCVEYTERTAFVLGNEGKGLRKLVKKKCNFLVRIPMQKNVQSLNVSVAAALLMYQTRGK